MNIDKVRQLVDDLAVEHLRGLWNPDMEIQLNYEGEKGVKPYRIPKDGNGDPYFHEDAYHPEDEKLIGLGVSGWDWQEKRSRYTAIDLDNVDGHVKGVEQVKLDEIVHLCSPHPEIEIIKSKSGKGYHLRVYFAPERAPHSPTRKHHTDVGYKVLAWLSQRLDIDLKAESDAIGVITWIYHRDRQDEGFKVVKPSTAHMPENWDAEIKIQRKPKVEKPTLPIAPKHQKLMEYLTARGQAEWDGKRLQTHTYHLLCAAAEPSLRIAGTFNTIATGKEGNSDRNCFCYPSENGSWKVVRHHQGTKEHESWWQSTNGWTTCYFNRSKKDTTDPVQTILAIAESEDQLFHDQLGRGFATCYIRNVSENIPLTDSRYKARLRLAYRAKTGRIATGDAIQNVVEHLIAMATQERSEYPVAVRIAHHEGSLYLDLCDVERRVVEITRSGWQVVTDCPVRFIRPFGLLPMPVPQRGGNLDLLKQFINVDESAWPTLMAWVVGCFHPFGPYALLSITGEQGSAKSWLLRFLTDFIDPQLATGNTLPRDERDALVSAQFRWLLSYDNVDELKRAVSSLLCMLLTGAASANRKFHTDSEQTVMRAKRPIVITSIPSVVTASDLLDRTLLLALPPIPKEQRKSEYALAEELRKDGVRGKILGVILDGVVSALAGHRDVKRDDMPRLADFFSWATAAEPAFGFEAGSAIQAVNEQANEESLRNLDSPLAQRIRQLCEQDWQGTPSDLAAMLNIDVYNLRDELNQIGPDLRRNGFIVKRGKANGKRTLTLTR